MTAARANPEAISEEFAAFMEAYSNSSQAVGPTKYKRLQEFMTGSFKNTLDVRPVLRPHSMPI